MALRETENNAYAKFRGDKQRPLWYVMAFSGVVNSKLLNIDACQCGTTDSSFLVQSKDSH